jgi:hypothetical protein
MELMARAQNHKILDNLIDKFVHGKLYGTPGNVENVFDMEDGFRDTIWMNLCNDHLKKIPPELKNTGLT